MQNTQQIFVHVAKDAFGEQVCVLKPNLGNQINQAGETFGWKLELGVILVEIALELWVVLLNSSQRVVDQLADGSDPVGRLPSVDDFDLRTGRQSEVFLNPLPASAGTQNTFYFQVVIADLMFLPNRFDVFVFRISIRGHKVVIVRVTQLSFECTLTKFKRVRNVFQKVQTESGMLVNCCIPIGSQSFRRRFRSLAKCDLAAVAAQTRQTKEK